ncbi:MAG: hypothetical protein D6693_08910 [Planctomycetota bacterium]|nr:MAG: hypothetical protein D6693_08910 [Planctomycetota bacterium]
MPAELSAILRLEVPLIVEIGARVMPLESILGLGPGSIIELPKGIDEELEIKVNNTTIGLGQAVKVGENFGVRVSFIGDVRERIDALGGASQTPKSDDEDPEDLAAALLAGQV